MLALFNFCRKVFSVFTILIMLLTGGINDAFTGDVYEYVGESRVIGLEALTRAQGVTNDGENFIFSGKNSLEKTTADCETVLAINTQAIPQELKDNYGSAHIGGISFGGVYIYCAVEDSKVWQHPLIVLYDADTLEYTGIYYELPTEIQTRGVPWVAVNEKEGVAYTGDSRNAEEIFVWNLTDFSYNSTITPEMPIDAIQGGEYHDGLLYLGSNDTTRAVYAVNVKNGKTVKLFDRITSASDYIDNFGGEGEDLTVMKTADGARIHTLQTGALFIDVSLRHYK